MLLAGQSGFIFWCVLCCYVYGSLAIRPGPGGCARGRLSLLVRLAKLKYFSLLVRLATLIVSHSPPSLVWSSFVSFVGSPSVSGFLAFLWTFVAAIRLLRRNRVDTLGVTM